MAAGAMHIKGLHFLRSFIAESVASGPRRMNAPPSGRNILSRFVFPKSHIYNIYLRYVI